MKKIIKIPLVLFIIIVTLILLVITSNASTTGVITEITVNVREKASLDSKVIMFVTQDDKVEVLEKKGDWYKIEYKNKQGYVYSEYVKIDNKDEITENNETNEALISEDAEVTKTIEAKLYLSKNTGVKITPNIMSNIIYTTTKDTEVSLIEKVNGWSYVKVEQISGWVRNELVKEATETIENKKDNEENSSKEDTKNTQKNEKAYVKYDSVNLRKEPSTDSTIIQKLTLNTEVTITEDVDSVWCKVKVKNTIGYVSKDLLSDKKQEEKEKTNTENNNTTSRDGETSTRENTTVEKTNTEEIKKKEVKVEKEEKEDTATITGEDIVAYAKKYLGYDYVYGGSSPKTGFDCSGFTQYVYKHFGYTISRSSVSQATNGTKVAKKDLQPGDLVIYKNHSLTRIGHVGIYIGNNKMIHASEPGVGVTITDIDSKAHKYPQRYVMGRRIIK